MLLVDIFFLIRAALTDNYVSAVPIAAGVLTAAGLLIVVYAEQRARREDRVNHRRISRVAHQLINPLRGLRARLESLSSRAELLPPAQRLELKRLQSEAEVLLDNIRDMFLLLQAQEGEISQDIRVHNICSLVGEAVERSRPLASARNSGIEATCYCGQAAVRADRRLLLIVLEHLIENALFYTMTPGTVKVSVAKGKRKARVIVQDKGIGIRPEDKEGVEQPFARGAGAEKYDPGGIGVGVALARAAVREVGGSLTWRSRKKTLGSQFEILLPLARSVGD